LEAHWKVSEVLMEKSNSPQGPAYPLQNAFSRRFPSMDDAMDHYLRHQYVRCFIYELPGGMALVVVHA
jgi:hypothetical protein